MQKRIFTTLLVLLFAVTLASQRASAASLTYVIDTPQFLTDGGSISGFFTYDPVAVSFAGAFHIVTGIGGVVTTSQVYDSGIGCAGGLTQGGSFNCILGGGAADFQIEAFSPQGNPEVYFPFIEHSGNFSQFRLGGLTPTPDGGSPSILAHPADTAVPEPTSLALIGSALVVLAVARRRSAAH